ACGFFYVFCSERELERRAALRNAQRFEETQISQDLVLAVAPWRTLEARRVRVVGPTVARGAPRAEHGDDGVRQRAAAVQLQRDVEAPRLCRVQELGQCAHVAIALGHAREARELEEVVDVVREACSEAACPRQADQRYARARARVPQCAQRRHGTQQVAEL